MTLYRSETVSLTEAASCGGISEQTLATALQSRRITICEEYVAGNAG